MLKLSRILFVLLLCSIPAAAMEKIQGFCEQGSKPVVTGGVISATRVMGAYANCTVTVFITGSGGTQATIYDSAGVATANPFTADQYGHYGFYVNNGIYDVRISGGGPPSLPTPYTFGAITAFDIRLTGLYDLNQYGAVADGTTDNTDAFNAAVADMPAGATLLIGSGSYSPGLYTLNSTITITKAVKLLCTSPAVVIQASVPDIPIFSFSGVDGAGIQGCTLDGGYNSQDGVSAVSAIDVSNFTLQNNRFQNLGATASMGAVDIVRGNRVWIQDNSFYNIGHSGVWIDRLLNTDTSSYIWINRNRFDTVTIAPSGGDSNIHIFGDPSVPNVLARYVWVQDNSIVAPGAAGIELNHIVQGLVSGNTIIGNQTVGEGIAFSGDHNIITNNKVSNAGAAGILLYSVSAIAMDHNVITNNMTWDNQQGIALVFGDVDAQITDTLVQGNRAFYSGSGHSQGYGLQTYCNTLVPSPGDCSTFLATITYANNIVINNDLSGNATGSTSITAVGVGNVYTNNVDDDSGYLNIISRCSPVALACNGALRLPTETISSANQYPIIANGLTQTGVAFNANKQFVAGVGFNDSADLGQLDLVAANANAIIGFYTPGHTSPINVSAISQASQAVVTVASVPSDVVVGSYIYLFSLGSSCSYLASQPQVVQAISGTNITIGTSGADCTYTSGGTYNTVQRSGYVDPRGWSPPQSTFANLTSAVLPFMVWCTNCNVVPVSPHTCTSGGSGAWAFRSTSWKCPF